MTTYVLDASAILRFTDKEAGFDQVRDLFVRATQGEVDLLLSAVNWGKSYSPCTNEGLPPRSGRISAVWRRTSLPFL